MDRSSILYSFNMAAVTAFTPKATWSLIRRETSTALQCGRHRWPRHGFKLTPSNGGWTESILYNFTGGSDGSVPHAGVVFDGAGNLYGTTELGGAYGCGTVFELTPAGSGWTESVLYSFMGNGDGCRPWAGVIFDHAGNLYGATPMTNTDPKVTA